jgi:peptide deformylase
MFRLPGVGCEPITLYGNPVLRAPARLVTSFDRALAKLVDDLFETMYATETGVGLAANQIGRTEQVFVFDCGPDEDGYVVNPVVETLGTALQEGGEGCLSLPGVALPTTRHDHARVTGVDVAGDPVVYEGHGLLARCFQHEGGHLQGRFYLDEHPPAVQEAIDAQLRAAPWFGTLALDPRSAAYHRAQES